MSRYLDAELNVIDTTGQNQPPMNAAVNGYADPQAVPNSAGNTQLRVNITSAGVAYLAQISNPA